MSSNEFELTLLVFIVICHLKSPRSTRKIWKETCVEYVCRHLYTFKKKLEQITKKTCINRSNGREKIFRFSNNVNSFYLLRENKFSFEKFEINQFAPIYEMVDFYNYFAINIVVLASSYVRCKEK